MLVDKETIVTDDKWSLTDEDPIESESEYRESDTSCSDIGSGDGDMEDGVEWNGARWDGQDRYITIMLR